MPSYVKIYKNREKMLRRRNRERKRNYKKSRIYSFGKRTWSGKEILILNNFKGIDMELAELLGRTVQSIQVKRSRLIIKE
jgi:hypothetical protein